MREENYFNPRLGALLRVPFREVYRSGCLSAKCTGFQGLHPSGVFGHVPPCTLPSTLREKSPATPANPSIISSNNLYPSPSPQSATYLVLYTLVNISTAVFYSEGLSVAAFVRIKVGHTFQFASTKLMEESSYPVRTFFHKVRLDGQSISRRFRAKETSFPQGLP